MTSTFYPVDDVLLNRYSVDSEVLADLEDGSLLDELEQMLYGDNGCLKSFGFRGGIPRSVKIRRGLE